MHRGTLCLLLLASGLLGCDGAPPKSVEVELPEMITNQDPVPITVKMYDAQGKMTIDRKPKGAEVTPEGIAERTAQGQLKCIKSGDLSVKVDIKGVSATGKVKCRLVDKVELIEPGRLKVDQGPVTLEAKVLDSAGQRIQDVPLQLRTLDAHVLEVKGEQIIPKQVGKTTVKAEAGGQKAEVKIEIVREVTDHLVINKGQRISYSLEPGQYLVEVQLDREKELGIDWIGAGACKQKKTAQVHESRCNLEEKGTVVIDHPSPDDDSAKWKINVQQIP